MADDPASAEQPAARTARACSCEARDDERPHEAARWLARGARADGGGTMRVRYAGPVSESWASQRSPEQRADEK